MCARVDILLVSALLSAAACQSTWPANPPPSGASLVPSPGGATASGPGGAKELWTKIRHKHQKVRLKGAPDGEAAYDYADEAEPGTTPVRATRPTPTPRPLWLQLLSTATKRADERKAPATTEKKAAVMKVPSPGATGAPRLENKLRALGELGWEDESQASEPVESLELDDAEGMLDSSLDDPSAYDQPRSDSDLVSKFLRVVESQHMLGENCTAGTETTLGEGVVDRYAQERFRLQAEVAVNRANWLTRMWKYADKSVLESEYLLHVNLLSIIEMDENIFAAGNCYDGQVTSLLSVSFECRLSAPSAFSRPQAPIQGLRALLSVRLSPARRPRARQGPRHGVQVLEQHVRVVLHRAQERRASHQQHDLPLQR